MSGIIASITQFLPTRWQPYVPLCVLLAWVLCKVVTVVVPPPSASSRWSGLYALISKLALNLGYAANAYQPGRSAVMVPCQYRQEFRADIAYRLGIPREQTKP